MTKNDLDCMAIICRNRDQVSEMWLGCGRFIFKRRGEWWAGYVHPTLGVVQVIESVPDIYERLERLNWPLHHYKVEA